MRRLACSALVVLALLPSSVRAQWALDGTALTTVPLDQLAPVIVSDGVGGVIIAWQDRRSGVFDIYAQRLNSLGVALWAASGVAVCTAANDQWSPMLVADGAGGAYVTWEDDRSGASDIYAQRVNAAGTPQWAANGVALCAAANIQDLPMAASDGSGGLVVVWTDRRSGTNFDLYAQRANSAGAVQWAANGILVCSDGADQDSPQIIANGAGSTIVVWRDWRFGISDSDIYAQRITAAGALQWSVSGTSICGSLNLQQVPQLVPDGAGGAVITWSDYRTASNWDIYGQRVNSAGSSQWIGNGIALCVDLQDQRWPTIAADGSGGAMIAWADTRFFNYDIYGQRVSGSGAPLWTGDGVALCGAAGSQSNQVVVPDGNGGFIVSWSDQRGGSTTAFSNVFAQRVNGTGATQWAIDGISVCSAPNYQGLIVSASDGDGGTVVAWGDFRSLGSEVYAQRIDNVYGFWGHPEPVVKTVKDIGHDQGGKVAVNWTASGHDLPNPRAIDFYSVWRAVDAIPMGVQALTSDELENVRADVTDPIYLSTPSRYYERVGTQTAHGWPGYSFSAATRADSVAGANGDTFFMVAAHYLYDNFVAFASNEVSGHSVDNLAPAAPLFLTAQRVGADVQLQWNGVRITDLRDYSVYRASSSGVTPVPINFFASSDDTVAVDPNAPASALYYIVTAYDVHANQSAPSNEASVQATTGIGDTPSIKALTVLQNHPNPFSTTTALEIGLPSNSDVSVEVFDVAGRRVSAFEVNGAKAGWNRIPFAARDGRGRSLASGVYFARITAAGATITKKMVIAR